MAAPKQGGFKMSLGGLKGKVGLKASPAQKEFKRPRLALGDDDEDDSSKQQEISGWDAAEGGAVDISGPKVKEAPRIIPALPNRNWRDEARRKQLSKAPHAQAQNNNVIEHEEPKVQYGLTILQKEEPRANDDEETVAPAEPMKDVKDSLTEEQRLDKKALDALLNGKSTDDDLVIPLQNEEEAFRKDLREAPDAPTLDTYAATPIEGFGAALLRGMGWKEGEETGKRTTAKPKEVKRRPALLGIGAKEEAAVGVELGGWDGGKGRGKKPVQNYNPVTLRNKVTGELITEEELKAKLEQQDIVQEEGPSKKERRKHTDDEEDDRRREKRKDKRDDRDRDRRREDDYDSERRRDRKDDRRREGEHHDSDRRRDKRKDKYREDDYNSERRRDNGKERERRHRSRSPDEDEGRRDKKRDRYRSRSRDSKRDRDRRDRSRDSDDRRKRRREKEYDDDREDRKRRYKDDKY